MTLGNLVAFWLGVAVSYGVVWLKTHPDERKTIVPWIKEKVASLRKKDDP